MNRTQVWQNPNLPQNHEVSAHDEQLLRRARDEINHAMDLIEDAVNRLNAMDCAQGKQYVVTEQKKVS